ncbi:MAG: hypothetical protein IPJ50_02970 [Betaproteobacteria bacterium]|nr:hypothetical protein [Betaproteobacteria bacterium]
MGVNAAVNRKNREKATGSSLARFNWIPADAGMTENWVGLRPTTLVIRVKSGGIPHEMTNGF